MKKAILMFSLIVTVNSSQVWAAYDWQDIVNYAARHPHPENDEEDFVVYYDEEIPKANQAPSEADYRDAVSNSVFDQNRNWSPTVGFYPTPGRKIDIYVDTHDDYSMAPGNLPYGFGPGTQIKRGCFSVTAFSGYAARFGAVAAAAMTFKLGCKNRRNVNDEALRQEVEQMNQALAR
ncbi:MAG: hypothetical protein COT73_06595 [Bdellovibrio sp. CG10_big_fil_rev_8_21_14_0_10_47_8]|nr:MAG: hypothetical protein COT73_06595 [Bdellovibrio sp. CG10_big_fil_rev_8_21_14_0_10_47_8]